MGSVVYNGVNGFGLVQFVAIKKETGLDGIGKVWLSVPFIAGSNSPQGFCQ